MTDPDAAALLRAIVRHPDEDTPRLVYADWLQENGRTEEAEFLRVQCQLAAAEPDDPEYPTLVERDEELRLWLTAHVPGPRPTFPAGLSVEGGSHWWQWTYRGFSRFLEFDGYARHGVKAMRALANAIERALDILPTRWLVVRFITVAQLAALLKHPVLARLSELTLQLSATGAEADEAARLVASCRHLRNLRGLVVSWSFGDAGCQSLANGPWENLEWFSPTSGEITPEGLRTLAGASWFRQLRSLAFVDDVQPETFEMLPRLPSFPRLHTLDVSRNSFLTLTGWQRLGSARNLPALTRLRVEDADLSGERFAALAGATGFNLSVLSVRQCGIGPGTGAALTGAPWIGSLRILDLSSNTFEQGDVKTLATCKNFRELRHLNLSGNALSPTGLSALAANPALRELRHLGLAGHAADNHGLTPTHFERFFTKLDMPDLRYLDLSGRPVGAKAVRKLADPKFSSLTRLGLRECKLTDPAVAALVTSPTLGNLIQLNLDGNRLTSGPEQLTDRSVLPRLASCTLGGNPLPAPVIRKLRRRPGVRL